jgi:RimJ/RimL family protein N-acetyltransferase
MSIPHFTFIDTERLRVRRFTQADAPTLTAYRNDPQVAIYQGWRVTAEAALRQFIADLEAIEPGMPGGWFQFAVELRAAATHIGDVALFVDTADPPQGMIGYSFDRAYQGHGYATEAVQAVLRYAFETLTLHRITAAVDCRNQPSWRLLERIGMRREGHFLQNVYSNGEWCDEYLYALLRSEWLHKD